MTGVRRRTTSWRSAVVGVMILAAIGPGGGVRAFAQETPHADAAALPPGTTILQTPEGDPRDLDGDGRPELVLEQGGCGQRDGKPVLTFVFRWRDDGYHAATADYPALQDAAIADLTSALAGLGLEAGKPSATAACLSHMLALAHAYQGNAQGAKQAYEQYLELRSAPRGLPGFDQMSVPGFVSEPYVREDVQYLLGQIEAGQVGAWSPSERAVLHDLIANGLEEDGFTTEFEAEQLWRSGQRDRYDKVFQEGERVLHAAADEYRAALALDPADPEAQAGLTRLHR